MVEPLELRVPVMDMTEGRYLTVGKHHVAVLFGASNHKGRKQWTQLWRGPHCLGILSQWLIYLIDGFLASLHRFEGSFLVLADRDETVGGSERFLD